LITPSGELTDVRKHDKFAAGRRHYRGDDRVLELAPF
jgi:hypothetical protein